MENAENINKGDLLRLLIDTLPDYIYVKDTESRFLLANAATARIMGVKTANDLIGKTDFDFYPQDLAQQYYDAEQRIIQSGQSLLNVEEPIIDQNTGARGWLSTTKVLFRDNHGNVIGLMGIGRDITQRKEAEEALKTYRNHLEDLIQERTSDLAQTNERLIQEIAERKQVDKALAEESNLLRTLINTLPDCIFVKDTQGRMILLNNATAYIMGAQSPDEIVGKTDFDFYLPEMAEQYYAAEKVLFENNQSIINLEEPHIDPDTKAMKWSLTSKILFRDTEGKIAGLMGISRDITDRKHAEEDLKKAHVELEQRALDLTAAYGEINILNEQLKEENLRMSAELNVARRLQEMVLPPPEELQAIEGLEIVGFMQPADEVGGDYYDVLKEHGMIHIGIGDVTGHGLESGVLMLMTQTAIRTLIEHGETDPRAFLTTLNRTLCKNIQRMKVDKTLTLVFVEYQNKCLKIVGQHEEVIVVRQNGRVDRVDTINLGFPIGLEDHIDKFVAEATIALQPGDGIVLYTDGITEAANLDGELYGVERLCDVLSRHWAQPVEKIKEMVIEDVTRHIGKQKVFDDLTLIILKQK